MMYQNRLEKVLPSLLGASLALMVPGGIVYGICLGTAEELSLLQKFLNLALFLELVPLWLALSYITAARDYRAILIAFLTGSSRRWRQDRF